MQPKSFLLSLAMLMVFFSFVAPARADEAELRQTIANYVDAFNRQDMSAIAGMWTTDATHIDRNSGERTEGRDAIVAEISAALQAQPDIKLAGSVDRIRPVTADVFAVEGGIEFETEELGLVSNDYTAILVQRDGKWLIHSIEESPAFQAKTAADALRKLEWLIGDWVDDADAGRVETNFRWAANRAFIIRSFVYVGEEGASEQGTQVIGWDPRSHDIRSWSFSSDGSFGDAVWVPSGEQWLIRSSQTLADGHAASGTYVLTKVDDNTIRLQLIGHDIEGEPQPSTPPVTVVRVPADAEAVTKPSDNP
jgi:uncharacterized protein (TIGR02246 family)